MATIKCAAGHFYNEKLPSCPFCKSGPSQGVKPTPPVHIPVTPHGITQVHTGNGNNDPTRVLVPPSVPGPGYGHIPTPTPTPTPNPNHTHIVINQPGGQPPVVRSKGKLVGWLVTYSFDEMGADFRIYEGKNVIGRDMDCNITVLDMAMSAKHATILYRKGDGFAIQDNGSTAGTSINSVPLGFSNDLHKINDNDIIRMGQTVFKFKSTL